MFLCLNCLPSGSVGFGIGLPKDGAVLYQPEFCFAVVADICYNIDSGKK
jgi:hypothetical protein